MFLIEIAPSEHWVRTFQYNYAIFGIAETPLYSVLAENCNHSKMAIRENTFRIQRVCLWVAPPLLICSSNICPMTGEKFKVSPCFFCYSKRIIWRCLTWRHNRFLHRFSNSLFVSQTLIYAKRSEYCISHWIKEE